MNRSGKIVLTSEPNNLMNLNSYKYSGLANSKAVGITVGKDKKDRTCGSLSIKVILLYDHCSCSQKRYCSSVHAFGV